MVNIVCVYWGNKYSPDYVMASAFLLSGGNPSLQWVGWGIACFSCSIWIYMGWKDNDIPRTLMEVISRGIFKTL